MGVGVVAEAEAIARLSLTEPIGSAVLALGREVLAASSVQGSARAIADACSSTSMLRRSSARICRIVFSSCSSDQSAPPSTEEPLLLTAVRDPPAADDATAAAASAAVAASSFAALFAAPLAVGECAVAPHSLARARV